MLKDPQFLAEAKAQRMAIEPLDDKESSVKISEAVDFESKTAEGRGCDLPENVIWRVDSLQSGFVILSA
jgi:hypothetical protein